MGLIFKNEKTGKGEKEQKLVDAIDNDDVTQVKEILEYASKKKKKIDLNIKNNNGQYPLLKATFRNNLEIVKLLIEYANEQNIMLDINDKDNIKSYPLLWATENNNFEIVKLLMDYANQHNIQLNLNEKDEYESYPLLLATNNNNLEMVQLLMEFSNDHNIQLNINDKNKTRNYPLLYASAKNNLEMVQLLMNYANKHGIQLIFDENENDIKRYCKNSEILKIWEKYGNFEERRRIEEQKRIEQQRRIEEQQRRRVEEQRISEEQRRREEEQRRRIEEQNRRLEEQRRVMKDILRHNTEEQRRIEGELKKREEQRRIEEEHRKIEEQRKKKEEQLKNEIKSDLTERLVIAINDFSSYEYNQLDIKKDEFLVVTDWYYEEGWVYGHRKDNPKEKGIFPKIFVKVCNNEIKEKHIIKNEITLQYRIEFDNKVKHFRLLPELKKNEGFTNININRNNLFNSSFINIMNISTTDLKRKLRIIYEGEKGIDAGGLLRDFFYQISKEIGNPNYLLFQYPHDNTYELEINPKSGFTEPNHLQYFRFIGRIIGLAIFHKQYLSVTFTPLFYKKLLNMPFEFSDLEFVDPEIYKSIKWLKENEGAENLCLTFEMDHKDCFGNLKKIELKPNGANINVTDSNKNEYIELMIENKLNNTNDSEQLESLKQGFYEIIPRDTISLFNELDLKLLISGINEIDVDDWENNTDYDGYTKDDITIINFWKCVREFDYEKQTKLLLFATGNSQVPVTGFKDLQGSGKIQHFKLKKTGDPENGLPISHTCFNRIDLPPYTSYTVLRQKLLLAISEGMGAFTID